MTGIRKNVLLLIVDCLRGDRCESYTRKPLRFIDYLCKNGSYFSQAFSVTSFTSPSVASILTGVYPFCHGIESFYDKLDPKCTTLAEILRNTGYTTCAMVTGPLAVHPQLGLDRGFDFYLFRDKEENLYSGFKDQIENYMAEMRKPWFLLVHLWELHYPVYFPKHLERKYVFSSNKYDRALEILDRYLYTLFSGILDETIVVLVADHGERLPNFLESTQRNLLSFLKRKHASNEVFVKLSKLIFGRFTGLRGIQGHGFHLYDPLIKVPLIFAGNEFARNEIFTEQVSQIDILLTIIDALGIPRKMSKYLQGRSLMPVMNGEKWPERPIYIGPAGVYGGDMKRLEGLRTSKWKYISIYNKSEPIELYDLENDSRESNNLVLFKKEIVKRFKEELKKMKSVRSPSRSTISETEKKKITRRLKTLGYL